MRLDSMAGARDSHGDHVLEALVYLQRANQRMDVQTDRGSAWELPDVAPFSAGGSDRGPLKVFDLARNPAAAQTPGGERGREFESQNDEDSVFDTPTKSCKIMPGSRSKLSNSA
jgi:hypothetical protein